MTFRSKTQVHFCKKVSSLHRLTMEEWNEISKNPGDSGEHKGQTFIPVKTTCFYHVQVMKSREYYAKFLTEQNFNTTLSSNSFLSNHVTQPEFFCRALTSLIECSLLCQDRISRCTCTSVTV